VEAVTSDVKVLVTADVLVEQFTVSTPSSSLVRCCYYLEHVYILYFIFNIFIVDAYCLFCKMADEIVAMHGLGLATSGFGVGADGLLNITGYTTVHYTV